MIDNRPTSRFGRPLIATALALATAATALLPSLAAADERKSRLELTPTIGFRAGGEFDDSLDVGFDFDTEVEESESIGLTLGIGLNNHWTLEFLWDEQDSVLIDRGFLFPDDELFDISVTYAHVGFTYEWTPGHVRPFVGASLGGTRFAPEPADLSNENRFSTSIGGGVKLMLNRNVGLRFEGRLFSTFLEDDEDFYCYDDDYYDDYCDVDEDFFFQAQARAGLILRF